VRQRRASAGLRCDSDADPSTALVGYLDSLVAYLRWLIDKIQPSKCFIP
jgi:hypothetical protein